MKIRTRLTLWIALVLAVTLAAFSFVLVSAVRNTMVAQVDTLLLSSPPPRVPPGPVAYPPNLAYGPQDRRTAEYIYGPDGELRLAAPSGFIDSPDSPPRLPPVPSAEADALVGRIVTVPSVDGSLGYRMLVRRGPHGEMVFTAAPMKTVDATITGLVQALLAIGAVALATSACLSWWLIRRGLRPVDRMVDTAAAIAAGDLSRRVPDPDPRSELGRLGLALNTMLGQIERAMRARAESEERLRRFVADAAHELRTPLTALRGYAELYRQGALPERKDVDGAMGRIQAESARMGRLVDDLLLLARLDQRRPLEIEPVDLAALVREALADFRAVDPSRPLTEALEAGATVPGDRIQLRHVLDNLLANARTHTPPGTPVHVSVRREGDHIALTVADEGPGINAEDQERIFERFWRADPSRVRKTGGSGLGLSIVDSIVRAHGGTISVTSAPGEGAAFTVRLPLAGRGPSAAAPAAEPPELVPTPHS